jgi:hypothetical protein
MASTQGFTDTDLGLEKIRKELAALGNKRIKAGVVKGNPSKDGALVSQYAAWNEFGVQGPPYSENGGGVWFIPPRSFIGKWLAQEESSIKTTLDSLYKMVADGKIDAETAMIRLGQFAQDGIKNYIMTGNFTPNTKRTRDRKNSSQPLIDSRTLLREIRYEIIGKHEPVEGPVVE